jgi:hypothetical protein
VRPSTRPVGPAKGGGRGWWSVEAGRAARCGDWGTIVSADYYRRWRWWPELGIRAVGATTEPDINEVEMAVDSTTGGDASVQRGGNQRGRRGQSRRGGREEGDRVIALSRDRS